MLHERPNQRAVERSYQRGRIGCLLLIITLQFGGIVALVLYAFNRPTVRTIDIEVPLPPKQKNTEPRDRAPVPTGGR